MPLPLLVTSIGNPGPKYASTLHSAGHYILTQLATWQQYPVWSPYQGGTLTTRVSPGSRFPFGVLKGGGEEPSLWRSGSMMNVSGPAVKRAWNSWRKDRDEGAKLVVVHDELEKELGSVSCKTEWKASAKGHNGIKSLQSAFRDTGFIRIGVGIGRPAGRDSATVSNYVLRPMTGVERAKLQEAVGKVWQLIVEIEDGGVV